MTNIEKIDYAYKQLEIKYGQQVALKNIIEFLKTGQSNYITSTNNARTLASELTYLDKFEILSKYSLMYFLTNKKEVTLTEEEVTRNTNDLNRSIEFTIDSAIETLVLINALNPYFGYNALAISKNMQDKIIESFVIDRYQKLINYDFSSEHIKNYAKFIKLNSHGIDKPCFINGENLARNINEIYKQEQDEYGISK